MTAPVQAVPDPLTPRQEFLTRMVERIKQRGGTNQEIAAYLHHAEGLPIDRIMNGVPKPEMPGTLRGMSMRALQGVTFGFGDEAMGSMLGMLTGEGASKGIDTYRQEMNAWSAEHRKLGVASEVGGNLLLTPLLAIRALGAGAKAATTMGRIGEAAKIGTAVGAATGAGTAEGDGTLAGNLSARAKGSVIGGLAGLLAAPVVTAGTQMAGGVTRVLARQAGKMVPWMQSLTEKLPGSVTPEAHARLLWRQAMDADGLTIESLKLRAQAAAQQGVPVTFVDLGGENMMQLASAAASVQGPAKQQLVESLMTRQADQGGRLLNAAYRSAKLGLRNAYDVGDELMASRLARATPLYQEAYQQTAEVTPRVAQLLKSRTFREAYGIGRQIAKEEDLAGVGHGLPVPELPKSFETQHAPPIAGFEGTDLSMTPTGEPLQLPIRALDYMKRGLDAVIDRAGTEGRPPLDRQHARALRSMLGEALADVSQQVPSYKAARDVWQSNSQMLDALKTGADGFTRKTPEVITRELAALKTPAEREMYRVGALQHLSDQVYGLNTEGPDVAKRFFGGRVFGSLEPSMAKRVGLLAGDPASAQTLADYVEQEARLSYTTRRVLSGSRTAPLMSAMEAVQSMPTTKGMAGGVTSRILPSLVDRAKTGWTSDVSDELLNLATRGLNGYSDLTGAILGLQRFGARRLPVSAGPVAQQAAELVTR